VRPNPFRTAVLATTVLASLLAVPASAHAMQGARPGKAKNHRKTVVNITGGNTTDLRDAYESVIRLPMAQQLLSPLVRQGYRAPHKQPNFEGPQPHGGRLVATLGDPQRSAYRYFTVAVVGGEVLLFEDGQLAGHPLETLKNQGLTPILWAPRSGFLRPFERAQFLGDMSAQKYRPTSYREVVEWLGRTVHNKPVELAGIILGRNLQAEQAHLVAYNTPKGVVFRAHGSDGVVDHRWASGVPQHLHVRTRPEDQQKVDNSLREWARNQFTSGAPDLAVATLNDPATPTRTTVKLRGLHYREPRLNDRGWKVDIVPVSYTVTSKNGLFSIRPENKATPTIPAEEQAQGTAVQWLTRTLDRVHFKVVPPKRVQLSFPSGPRAFTDLLNPRGPKDRR
jgi:hypothetical protein